MNVQYSFIIQAAVHVYCTIYI